jgi:hypothetical protein
MNKSEKIKKLKALTESVKATQAKISKAKKLEESLRATNIGVLLEAELEQAEVILAAKDFVSKLQKMAEDLANMQAESIPLGDSMKETLGPDAAHDFENAVTTAIADGLVAVRAAKDTISDSISRVEGGEPEMAGDDLGNDMGDLGDDLPDLSGDTAEVDDAFGGAESAAGPEDEPLGRGMKESYKSIGQKLLMKESLESLVSWLMEDVAATMPVTQLPKFASQIAVKSAKDSDRLAGWIGSRKYGKGLGAQLSSPLNDSDDSILDESLDEGAGLRRAAAATKKSRGEKLSDKEEKDLKADTLASRMAKDSKKTNEGKSYKYDDEEADDAYDKKKDDRSRRDAAKAKRDIEEGKSFKHDDEDEDDTYSKKKDDRSRRDAAKAKRTIEEAVRLIIERNIAKTGKGFAAKAIAEAQSMFPMVESSNESIVESFVEAYGMTPMEYSIKKAKAVAEDVKLNPKDKEKAASVMSKIAGDMTTDRNLGNKGVQQAMSKMDAQERTTAQKVINNAKGKGKDIKKVQDLVDATKGELEENINAAQWPINSMGQYKGEPFSTDYQKLKADKTAPNDSKAVADTPKAADAPKADSGESKPAAPKAEKTETKSEKPAFLQKKPAKEESSEDTGSEEKKD